jgi:hypothetical protein
MHAAQSLCFLRLPFCHLKAENYGNCIYDDSFGLYLVGWLCSLKPFQFEESRKLSFQGGKKVVHVALALLVG